MSYYKKYLKNKIGCFSPPVMIATFIIEICLALFTLFRYKRSLLTGLSIALFVFLALFQLAEYFVCGGAGRPKSEIRLPARYDDRQSRSPN